MPDSVDAISVIQELHVCHLGSGINLAAPDVNDVPEAEILVCNASASPSNCNLNSSEPDEAANVDPHEHGSTSIFGAQSTHTDTFVHQRLAIQQYAGTAWDELKHMRQPIGFLVVHQKPKKTLNEITNELRPNQHHVLG
ncbi:unnamed protein product [Lactuca saligna]|uniref:Uncharacterized protein n=1 Tax=Lactuca saligna TaxID=75948 RepID=A0AA36EEC1_LACSI|nr:unnamed protein product [Lactuca saligna]